MTKSYSNWVGRTIAGRYKLEAVLGRGGMSTVYRATDPNLQRLVALKLIHPHLSNDPEFVRRFEQEAAAVAQLRHPNIVQVYDFNNEGDLYYMVLEFVAGETLQAKLKAFSAAKQRLPLSDAIHITTSLCEAVAYAHNQGMIHRDLKPANVMLTLKGQPILMDFGVAKMLGVAHFTATGAIIGTAKYMSPEQARGRHPDERSDIYSLGVMLFEMATGQPPYEADSDVGVLMKHTSDPIPDARQLNRNTPDPLVTVIEKALAKNPAERYQSASDMARALRAVELPGRETVPSGTLAPSSSKTTIQSPRRKLPLWLAGAAAAIVLVIGLALGLVYLASQLRGSSAEEQAAAPATTAQTADQSAEEAPPAAEEEVAPVVAEESNLPTSERMVQIDGGAYTVGHDTAGQNHVAPQQVNLNEFWIDQYEVTNQEFGQFVADTEQPPPASWPGGVIPAGEENHPVKGIPWAKAAAYCSWAKKRLPSEAEWEVAARGREGRLYPWGDDQRAVELPRTGSHAVGSIAESRSPFGVYDMAGNVWEWVGEPYAPVTGGNRVLRGGENGFLKDMAYRLIGSPDQESFIQTAGLRCAADEVRVVESVVNLLYEDDFTDPASGWQIEDVEGVPYRVGYHPPDYYHVEVRETSQFTSVAHQDSFDNATVETNLFVDFTDTEQGDFRYGLILRRQDEDQFYAFTISPRSGRWHILKQTPDGLELLSEGTTDTLEGLTSGVTDHLRVDAQGSDFVFHINEEPVAHITDSDYPSGQIGFYVETFDESLAHIHYDTLAIREVEEIPADLLQVLYEDDFTDPASGWQIEDVEGVPYRVGYHPPDYYHVEVREAGQFTSVAHQDSFDNATVETNLFVDFTDTEQGDFRYGLILRRQDEDQFYAFTISPRSGRWHILKQTPDGLELLSEGTTDTLEGLTSGVTDHLRVDAQGSDFVFHINEEPVAHITDSDYPSGQIGFYVETFDESLAHIHYDTLAIREVEEDAFDLIQVPYEDDFTDPASGWQIEDVEGVPYRVGYHPPDYYHVEVREAGQFTSVAHQDSFDNATVETNLFVDFTDTEQGDFRYGLILRRQDEDQFYAFTISPRSGRWHILKQTPDGLELLSEGTTDTLEGLTSGVTDHLRVDAQGSDFVFHINEEPVAHITDSDYPSGQIGFYVETFDESLAHIHYDTLRIREVEEDAFDLIPVEPSASPTPAVPEGMALVPAGYFRMGSSTGQSFERPVHPVFLDAFYIDLHEVTNAEYRECVADLGCTQPGKPDSATRKGYRDNPAYDDYPVINVTWDQADAYCKWAGKHLPTEAQWEYAADGSENFTWPWGDTFKASLSAAGESDTQPVGSYPEGVSPFGVFDMAGNVAEWVLDDFDEEFYANSPTSNPVNTDVSAGRIFRGGSFGSTNGALYTTSRRDGNIRTFSDVNVGFRCALDAPEVTSSEERATLMAEFCEVYDEYKPDALCP